MNVRRGLTLASLGLFASALFVACAQLAGIDQGHLAADDAEAETEASNADASDASDAQVPIVVPEGMVLIAVPSGGSFFINAKETTVAEYDAVVKMGAPTLVGCPSAFSARSATMCGVIRQGSLTTDAAQPVNCVTWCDAARYCAAKGKRLCGAIGGGSLGTAPSVDPNSNEWARACGGVAGHSFPYGDVFDAGACNVFAGSGAMLPEGGAPEARASCEGSAPGLYDLGGSLAEWTNGQAGELALVEGAAYRYTCADNPKDCTCQSFHAASVAAHDDVGIRCCKDVDGH